jgi:hypothetical protein
MGLTTVYLGTYSNTAAETDTTDTSTCYSARYVLHFNVEILPKEQLLKPKYDDRDLQTWKYTKNKHSAKRGRK